MNPNSLDGSILLNGSCSHSKKQFKFRIKYTRPAILVILKPRIILVWKETVNNNASVQLFFQDRTWSWLSWMPRAGCTQPCPSKWEVHMGCHFPDPWTQICGPVGWPSCLRKVRATPQSGCSAEWWFWFSKPAAK